VASIELKNNTTLSDFGKPYIVAEINTSHFGILDTAKKMIERAKAIGCDCVKFQSWSSETLYSSTYYAENPIAKRFVNKFALSNEDLIEVATHAQALDMAFASTPYSNREVEVLLNECNASYIKIASMDLNNYPFLDFVGRTGSPIVLSTGMGDTHEILKAVETIERTGNKKIAILHCTSIYPTLDSAVNLNNILGLRKNFPNYPIGFSDHSVGTQIASAAVALGACMIEKHFTLDKSRIGMDNQMATEPQEMELLVSNCHSVFEALGTEQRVVGDVELEQRKKMRRSIVFVNDLPVGALLTERDVDFKRPGTGYSPEQLTEVIGRRLVKDAIADTLLTSEHIFEKEMDSTNS
jgi:N-acetylneuraminate synthase